MITFPPCPLGVPLRPLRVPGQRGRFGRPGPGCLSPTAATATPCQVPDSFSVVFLELLFGRVHLRGQSQPAQRRPQRLHVPPGGGGGLLSRLRGNGAPRGGGRGRSLWRGFRPRRGGRGGRRKLLLRRRRRQPRSLRRLPPLQSGILRGQQLQPDPHGLLRTLSGQPPQITAAVWSFGVVRPRELCCRPGPVAERGGSHVLAPPQRCILSRGGSAAPAAARAFIHRRRRSRLS